MSDAQKPNRMLGRLLRKVRSAFSGTPATNYPPAPEEVVVAKQATPATAPSAQELINEGLQQRQRHGAAAAQPFFEKAAQIEPNSHVPSFMLGNVASEIGDLDVAVDHYERARDLQPNDHIIRYNLGLNNVWRGYIDAAIEELHKACDLNPSYLPAQSSYLMALLNSDRATPEEIAAATREWGARFSKENPESLQSVLPHDIGRTDRLRVGFVSGDFRTHSVAHFFEPILSAHDRSAFTYVLYSNFHLSDAVTERLRAYADEWRDIWHLSDEALIKQISADRIDILVDLSGHTVHNRLAVFARRAAPVQITYLGYPGSTGLTTIDFRITDEFTDPEEFAGAWHSERLLRLPHSQWCFRPFGNQAVPAGLPADQTGFVTFGSFNNLTKASDTVLRSWVRILMELPTSHLRLTRIRSPRRAAEIVALFQESGVSAERIECVASTNDPPYGLQFSGVDIALDHYPYNGVTTTCECLYFGVPVISLYGRNCVSRSGLSLLSSLGLSELVASTPVQYVGIAVALARDPLRLKQLRASLRARFEQSPLRDERRFAAEFEKVLRAAWQQVA